MGWGVLGSLMSSIRRIFKQDQMEEAELSERCTIKSHGRKVASHHKYDWFILLILAAVELALVRMHPFYRFVGKDMMTDLKYPLKENTVPTWSVGVYGVILPVVIFVIIYIWRRDVYDLHHGILGLLYAVLITGIITDSIKLAAGRPRPDFFWRCFPDGIDKYDNLGNVICHGIDSVIKEGHKSFPSGHASWSFAGLGFLSMYLSGKLKAFNRKGHIAKLCLVFLPLLAASLVGVSRVDDYRHHWEDVFAGGLIGLVVAMLCYLQFFPAPYHSEGWGPYAYFKSREESHRARAAQSTDSINRQAVELRTVNPTGATILHSGPDHDHDDSSISLELLETGRR
ncbi:unnamed protein product [Rhodiola kirilowii]